MAEGTNPLGALFGEGSVVRQIVMWQVFAQVVGSLLQPYLELVQEAVQSNNPVVPLSPAQLSDLVVKGFITEDDAAQEAAKSGINHQRFHQMVLDGGEALDTTTLLEAFRRGKIAWDTSMNGLPSVLDGIREGHLADKWAPVIQALGTVRMGVADAVDAVVENQISDAEGQAIAQVNGLDPQDWPTLVNTRGNPPSPTELVTLYKRGLIPLDGTGPDKTSVHQGIAEGATKDKWWRLLADLVQYYPTPSEVATQLASGDITSQQADQYWQWAGVDPEWKAAMAKYASHSKLNADLLLAKSDVVDGYYAQLISKADATSMLEQLGYTGAEVTFLLSYQDYRRELVYLDYAIKRTLQLYVSHKINRQEAANALQGFKLPPDQVTQLITTAEAEAQQNVALPTASQVVDGVYYNVIDQATAMSYLGALGYTPYDAWMLISVRLHGPQPNQPAPGAGPVGSVPGGGEAP